MLGSPAARSLAVLISPLLAGCGSSGAAEVAPWALGVAADATSGVHLAVDGSGAVALSGQFSSDLALSSGTLLGDGRISGASS